MNPNTKPNEVSVREFARRIGVAAPTVSEACKNGRLRDSVRRDPATGRVVGIDLGTGLAEWAKNTDSAKAPPAVMAASVARVEALKAPRPDPGPVHEAREPLDLADAAAEGKYWDARLKEAKYLSLVGKLVPSAQVEAKIKGVFLACRSRLLGVPSRAKQLLPHLTVDDVLRLEALIREVCEELSLVRVSKAEQIADVPDAPEPEPLEPLEDDEGAPAEVFEP